MFKKEELQDLKSHLMAMIYRNEEQLHILKKQCKQLQEKIDLIDQKLGK